ncbi:unnamed protein product [Meloidogyne enterolobii]
MMVANAHNLIITIKPANQRNSLQRTGKNRNSGYQDESQNLSSFTNDKIPITNGSGGRVYPANQQITQLQTSNNNNNIKHFHSQNERQKQQQLYEEDNDDDEGEEEEDEIVDHTKTALKIR